jgi:hypothetical protein
MDTKSYHIDELISIWERIGKKNIWIREAYDPPFDRTMLKKCDSIVDLQAQLAFDNWCLGQGFFYENLCFINQVASGDEWLTIRNDLPFESFTFAKIIRRGKFPELIERLFKATDDQLRNLTY